MVLSHSKSQIIPDTWKNDTDKLFAEGVGRNGDTEMVLMEFSPSATVTKTTSEASTAAESIAR